MLIQALGGEWITEARCVSGLGMNKPGLTCWKVGSTFIEVKNDSRHKI